MGAREHGPVRVVTVRTVGGRPRITTTVAAGRRGAEAVIAVAQQDPTTVSVALDQVLHAVGGPAVGGPAVGVALSNDSLRGEQWGLSRLRAEQTWAVTTGSGVTVAVVDTGVEATHADLSASVLPGIDLVAPGDGSNDQNGHGTHVAGIVAATAGNALGVAGLAPGVKILPVRVLGADGSGDDSVVAEGITQAVDRGAAVINLSLGGSEPGATADAVRYALSKGVVVVAAAGNERAAGDQISYPAADPGVLAVAATDAQDHDATFSNTGSYVALAAPGVAIWSTYKDGGYLALDGTSMAAPYVAASAALVRSVAPGLTPADVAALLERTASDLGPVGRDDATGFGLVNPEGAVCSVVTCPVGPSPVGPSPVGPSPVGPSPVGPSPVGPSPVGPSPVGPTPVGPSPVGPVATVTRLVGVDGVVVGFGRVVSVSARVVTVGDGAAVGGAPASVCVATAPATTFGCAPRTTGADGWLHYPLRLLGATAVYVTYPGSTAAAPSTSPTVTYLVSPRLTPHGAPGVVTAEVAPGGAWVVTLDRWTGRSWVRVGSARGVGRVRFGRVRFGRVRFGRVRFGRLRSGRYRVRTPATGALAAAISGPVQVR